jgi:hypothetical protein
VALNAHVVGTHVVKFGRIDDRSIDGILQMRAAGAMTLLAADVPLGHPLCLDVVVNGMTSVTKCTGRPLFLFRRIERGPPLGTRFYVVRTPLFVADVPLRRHHDEVVADAFEVALFPLAPVGMRDVVFGERHERVRSGKVAEDGLGTLFHIL